jgi:hypothetical protein
MMAAAATAANIDLPEFPMTPLPRWFDFYRSNHQGNEIVNKASGLSAVFSPISGAQAAIVDNPTIARRG